MVILFEAAHTRLISIVSDVIPAGQAYRIAGEAEGVVWTVAEGVGIGTTVQAADPFAPFDVATVYTVTAGASADQDWLTRTMLGDSSSDTVMWSADGRAHFSILWEGDAASAWNPGASYGQPRGRRFPVQVLPMVPGGPSWAFECRVELDAVADARATLLRGRVWVAHSHERCTPGCPLPRAMLAGVDGNVSEGSWPDGRTFAVSLRQLDPGVTGVPVVTWGEAARAGIAWGPTTTFDVIRRAAGGD